MRVLHIWLMVCLTLVVMLNCSDRETTSDPPQPSSGGGGGEPSGSGGGGDGGAGFGGMGSGEAGGGGGCMSGSGGGTVRVASWNIGAVGAPGTSEHDAALAVLDRIGADIVGMNEVNGAADVAHFHALAFDAGYEETLVADSSSPFGSQRNAFLSRLPIIEGTLHDAASLSGDPAANDITRLIPEITVNVNGCPLTIVVDHWKSGLAQADVFRRAVESHRMAQAVANRDGATHPIVILGDVNDEIDDISPTPTPFFAAPPGLPPDYVVGADIQALLATPEGIVDNPFTFLLDSPPGVIALNALQLDGNDATRPDSGRRLDYLFASAALTASPPPAEVYDSADETLAGGLPKVGAPLSSTTSLAASDHLLVFADLSVPGCECAD